MSLSGLQVPVLAHARRGVVMLHPAQSVDQALSCKRHRRLAEKIVYFYVVDDAGRLCGVVPIRRLLMSPPEATIGTPMDRRLVTLPATATVLDARDLFTLYRLIAFPVVDEQQRLLGVVDVELLTEEVFELAESKSTDALLQLIGVHVAEARAGSSWVAIRRSPSARYAGDYRRRYLAVLLQSGRRLLGS